jgi:hypothetical protein
MSLLANHSYCRDWWCKYHEDWGQWWTGDHSDSVIIHQEKAENGAVLLSHLMYLLYYDFWFMICYIIALYIYSSFRCFLKSPYPVSLTPYRRIHVAVSVLHSLEHKKLVHFLNLIWDFPFIHALLWVGMFSNYYSLTEISWLHLHVAA